MKWIPVKDELPKEEGQYLVTEKLLNYYIRNICNWSNDLYKLDKYEFPDKKGVAGWYDSDPEWGYYGVDNVVAWIKLPEPYKG